MGTPVVLNRWPSGAQRRAGRCGEKKGYLSPFRNRTLDRPAPSLVAIPPTASRPPNRHKMLTFLFVLYSYRALSYNSYMFRQRGSETCRSFNNCYELYCITCICLWMYRFIIIVFFPPPHTHTVEISATGTPFHYEGFGLLSCVLLLRFVLITISRVRH